MLKSSLFRLVIMMALLSGFSTPAFSQVVVNFPDANLEAIIRQAIGKPTGAIFDTDLEELTSLYAYGSAIGDLTGLEYCTNLTALLLYYNQITDICPLAGLTNLTWLYLYGNQISDISCLAGLTNLTRLYLTYNPIIDISALAGLTNLTDLLLFSNQISDISPLVANPGIDSWAWVGLSENPLNCESIINHIPTLQARGVTVEWTANDSDEDNITDDCE
jgi:hypothetical protein